jgi:hypothetical protein
MNDDPFLLLGEKMKGRVLFQIPSFGLKTQAYRARLTVSESVPTSDDS